MVLNKKPPPKPVTGQKPAPAKPGAPASPGQNLQPKPAPASGRVGPQPASAQASPESVSQAVKTLSDASADTATGILGLESAPVGKIFAGFMRDIAPKLTLAPTSHAILRDFS